MKQYDNLVIISSRIRLARNLSGFNFPSKLSLTEASDVVSKVFDVLKKFENYKVTDLSPSILNSLKEKHLISQTLIDNKQKSAISLSADETICIMVNEEEHLRLQCILKGYNLNYALVKLNEIDDLLLENLSICYDADYGFVTTCPSNLGTGMRASVMLYLPALSLIGSLQNLIVSLQKQGITIRGCFGEGTNADGFMFQVSNSQTLGLTEEQIICNVKQAVKNLCEKELAARQTLLNNKYDELLDTSLRAYGILKYCHKIDSQEATKLLSQLRLGVCLNIIDCVKLEVIDRLFEEILPNTLSNINGNELSLEDLDFFRAKYIAENI